MQYAPDQYVWNTLVLSSIAGSTLWRKIDEDLVDEIIEENVELTKR